MTEGRQQFEDLAALCAAGAATAEEHRQLEAIIAADPEAEADYRTFCDAGALLAEALPAVAPPPGVLEQLQSHIAREPTTRTSVDKITAGTEGADAPVASAGASTDADRGADIIDFASRRRRTSMFVATGAVLAAAAMALLWIRERGDTGQLREQLARERQLRSDETARARQQIAELTGEIQSAKGELSAAKSRVSFVSTPQIALSTLQKQDGPTVKIFVDPDKRRWLVFAYELPPIPDDKDYQLWFISPQSEVPVSAGLLHKRPDGALETELDLPADLTDIQQAAISLEKKGGSPMPTMDQIKIIGPL